MSDALIAMVARRSEALARRDVAALLADYADHCVLDSPGWGHLVGRDAIGKAFREFFAAFPDCQFEFGEPWCIQDRAMHTFTVSGTDTGGLFGQPATGKPFRLFLIYLITVADQRIVQEHRVYDVGGLMMQLASGGEGLKESSQLYKATLERARTEHELRTAAQIQRALMPLEQRMGDGFNVAATSRPCRAIGGDFIDYFNLSDGAFGFVLGDVAGKGPAAALLAAVLQGVFTANANRQGTPATRIAEANEALVRRGIDARFATAIYAVLTPDGRLTYCNAGHNPPLLVRTTGLQRLEAGGLIVGMFEEAAFDCQTIQLEPGDLLIAFSDGITEARNAEGEEFGEARLLSCVTSHRELTPSALLQRLFDSVQQFSVGAAQADDLTVLVLSYTGDSSR
jgi:serine phosphatase RsbU (regulator of sigma subunit)